MAPERGEVEGLLGMGGPPLVWWHQRRTHAHMYVCTDMVTYRNVSGVGRSRPLYSKEHTKNGPVRATADQP